MKGKKENILKPGTRIPYSIIFLLVIAGVTLAACNLSPGISPPDPTLEAGETNLVSGRLVIYSGRTEPLIQPVLAAFQEQYPEVDVRLKAGSNSELANAILEERHNPQADIFITTEMITIQVLNREGVLESYRSPAAGAIPSEFIGPDDGWTGITRRVRVIMVNTDLVPFEEAPRSIFELVDPKWKGQIASAGSTNGSMQAQIAAMRQLIGEDATEDWLRGLLANDVTFFGGHTDVRKAVGVGEFKIGLVNHYYYYLQKQEGSPVGLIFPDQEDGGIGLISNATSVGIIKGASNLVAAQALVDFLVSNQGQEIFARLNFEYPLGSGAALHPDVEPLDNYRLAEVDVAKAALELDETLNLIDRVGMP